MLNQLNNIFRRQSGPMVRADPLWDVDDHPDRRLIWLMVLFCLPFSAVVARLGWIQIVKTDRFLESLARPMTKESFEPIPSQCGRILSADGEVLAYDEELFVVKMHYRWIEDPPNARWLRERALERLSREERGDKEKVDAQREVILNERDRLWQSLGEVTGRSADELKHARQNIQDRVARIRKDVESRREARRLERLRHTTAVDLKIRQSTHNSNKPLSPIELQNYWDALKNELTTLSTDHEYEPLILQEELDYHELIAGITLATAANIESHPEIFPGIVIESTSRRIYPDGSFAPHIVGFRAPISDEELARRRKEFPKGDPLDYQPGDRIGKTGVEKSYDRQLRGLRGLRRIVKNRRGEVILTEVVREPRMGQDVILTLHPSLQREAESLLERVLNPPHLADNNAPANQSASDQVTETDDGPSNPQSSEEEIPRGASLVVIDIHTGALLAGVSAPGFDVNDLLGEPTDNTKRVLEDKRRPLFPRMTHMAIPPGSVFKTVSSVAILESGTIDPDQPRYCQGYLFEPNRYRCYKFRHFGVGHGELTFQEAFAQSCNVYFFDTARDVGFTNLSGWAERLGFGKPSGIDLPGEKTGSLPRPRHESSIRLVAQEDDSPSSGQTDRRSLSETLGLAIGQSRLTATPIQIARLMAVVANGGELVTPHVVDSYGPMGVDYSERQFIATPSVRVAVSSDSTWERLREALERVVSHPSGTGYKTVRLEQVGIAGKTGTAEVGGGLPDHAWFAGYVPTDRPRYAFVVVLENGGSGGRSAGPVVRQLVETMIRLELLPTANVAGQR